MDGLLKDAKEYDLTPIEKAKELAIDGLMTDGGWHKQWYLEEIIKALGYDLNEIRKQEQENGYDWDDGIVP